MSPCVPMGRGFLRTDLPPQLQSSVLPLNSVHPLPYFLYATPCLCTLLHFLPLFSSQEVTLVSHPTVFSIIYASMHPSGRGRSNECRSGPAIASIHQNRSHLPPVSHIVHPRSKQRHGSTPCSVMLSLSQMWLAVLGLFIMITTFLILAVYPL